MASPSHIAAVASGRPAAIAIDAVVREALVRARRLVAEGGATRIAFDATASEATRIAFDAPASEATRIAFDAPAGHASVELCRVQTTQLVADGEGASGCVRAMPQRAAGGEVHGG